MSAAWRRLQHGAVARCRARERKWSRCGPAVSGMTLVELLIAAVIGAAVVAGAWLMFLSGSRQSVKLEAQLGRVQSALILLENIADDVAGAVVIPPDGSDGNLNGGPDLKLYRFLGYDLDAAEGAKDPALAGAVRTEPVLYHFDASAGTVTRNGRLLPLDRIASLKFKPPDTFVPGVQVDLSVASSGSGGPLPAAFHFLLPVERHAQEEAFDSWQENYYDMRPVSEAPK